MMTDRLQDLTHALLDAAKKAGAEQADALAVSATALSIDIRRGALEQAERSEATDMGLRVIIGGRSAIVSASDTSARTIADMAERAVAMAGEAPVDPYTGLADPGQLAKGWDLEALDLCDKAPEPDAAALEADARAAEAAAMAGGAVQVEASGHYARQALHMAATNGFDGGYARTSRSISAVAFVGQGTGMERDWSGETRVYQADLPGADTVGALAIERAKARLGARKPATGAYPMLFDERVASTLIGHLLSAANGSAIARGASWLRDSLGQQVLPKGMTVVEDPRRARIGASRPFDGEGLATARRVIVEDGILQGWTLDLATGRKLGMASTANAVRGTSSPPAPATSNIDLSPGTVTRDDLIRDMGTGLLITSLIGSTVNPTTGDYSRGASGFWVENGQIAYPVNECTVAGNLRDFLLRLTAANDARQHLSTRVPSLLVEGLTLAGA